MTITEPAALGREDILDRLLTTTRDVLQAHELTPALESVARAVVELFGFKYVTIVAADFPGGDLKRRVVLGWPEAVIEERLGEHVERNAVERLLQKRFEIVPNCYYVSAEDDVHWERTIYAGDMPLDAPRTQSDAWHERDLLALVLSDSDGEMLGYLSADGPHDGRIPSRSMLEQMQLFVNLVALALANTRAHRSEVERRELLEQHSQLQTEFFAMVSHEVRSPLSAIRGATAILESHFDSLSLERRNELLSVIGSSTTRLSTIFDDFLLLSRMDAGKLTLRIEPVDPIAICTESIARMESEHPGREFCMAYIQPVPMIRADEGRVVQILTNLLSNASKYSFANTPVTVEIKVYDDRVLFAISNEGRGIDREDRGKLFTRFGHLSHSDGSTGLGLHICAQLTELMNGRVGCESEPNKRTTFWFTMPRADVAALAQAPSLDG